MLAGSVLAQPFFQFFNQQVAFVFNLVLDLENLLALCALDFFKFADFVLQGVLFVNGGSEPFDDVYTDRAPMNELTEKINKSIRQNDGPFTIEAGLQWWVVIMLGVMGLMSLAVESALVFRAAYRWWVSRHS